MRKIGRDRLAKDVFEKVWAGGKLSGRARLSYTGTSVTYADVTVSRACGGELRETYVLTGLKKGNFCLNLIVCGVELEPSEARSLGRGSFKGRAFVVFISDLIIGDGLLQFFGYFAIFVGSLFSGHSTIALDVVV
jgi:hypothetical protein